MANLNFFTAKPDFFTAKPDFFTAKPDFITAKPDFFTAKLLKFLYAMPCAHAPQAPKIAAAEKTMAVDEESEDKLDDENLTKYYYYKGFQYKEICMFLQNTWAA